tara:strand:- start:234 stop:659 length:426 start_codon:yes stop_codon:yes gene_type:complete
MLKKFFKKKISEKLNDKAVLITSLLVRAAKIDENYTDLEKKIIEKAIMELFKISENEANKIIISAEQKEKESNQIINFTKEIKKYPMEFRLKIIEIVWKIVYSDGIADSYESNLINRICGLLYISGKDNGIIREKVQSLLK